MQYLLDTNICIYIIKKKPPTVFEKFNNLVPGDIGISSVTVAELEYGIAKSRNPEKNRKAIEKFLAPLEVVEFGFKEAKEYGEIRVTLEKQGNPIGGLDNLIAAHAKALGLTLVTNNFKEFSRIDGLEIEDWT